MGPASFTSPRPMPDGLITCRIAKKARSAAAAETRSTQVRPVPLDERRQQEQPGEDRVGGQGEPVRKAVRAQVDDGERAR